MPRVKRIVVPPAPPRMPDRPGRWKLLLRRQRRMIKPTLLGIGALGVIVAFGLVVRAESRGLPLSERVGSATAELGLRVRYVDVSGDAKTPRPAVLAALGVAEGEAILGFSVRDARARLERLTWVLSATVERQLPDRVVVQLVERAPYAVWQNEGRFVLIDRAGEPVAEQDVATFAKELPLVVGPGAPHAVAALMDALDTQKEMRPRIVAAVRVDQRRWNLHMNNGGDVLLPEGQEVAGLARLASLQSQYAVLDRPLQIIDLRAPDRLVLRPQPDKAPAGDKAVGERQSDPSKPPGRKPT